MDWYCRGFVGRVVLIASIALLAVAGCGDSEPPAQNDGECPEECQVGDAQCRGADLEYCLEVDGCEQWSEPVECEGDRVCSDGRCVVECDDECTPGERSCEDTGSYRRCEYDADGCAVWAEPVACGESELCSAGECLADCDDECNQGETRCDGEAGLEVCQMQADGCTDWSATVDCQGDSTCTDGVCTSGDETVCPDNCNQGETECETDGLRVCQEVSEGCWDWTEPVACPDGTDCQGGECVVDCSDECTQGDTRCEGGGLEVCEDQADGCLDWSGPVDCPDDHLCEDGQCIPDCSDECTDGETRCTDGGVEICEDQADGCLDWSGPVGCPDETTCVGGVCETTDEEACSADNPDGACPDDQICEDGECIPEECSEDNPDGLCPPGETCEGGDCIEDPLCDCEDDETCIDGQCHPEDDACSEDNPDGLCESGYDCVEGQCTAGDQECSADNPDGICPTGQWCDDGDCIEIDDGVCTDRNDCTTNAFDFDYNLCLSQPDETADCDDGNPCTDNWCDGGECKSDPVDGCEDPPELDPFDERTDSGSTVLSGTKPAGSGIKINNSDPPAVSENDDTEWSHELPHDAGPNHYEIKWFDGTEESETREIEIYYDTEAPTTTVTPEGGTFLDGINVQVTTDEPADVYYTTDGTEPTSSSESFRSIRQFRIFEPTELRFRARDDAGNWEEQTVVATFEITSYGNDWSDGPQLWDELHQASAAQIEDVAYVAAGSSEGSAQTSVRAWDFEDQQWSSLPSLEVGRTEAGMASLGGELYLAGGQSGGAVLNDLVRLDPEEDDGWEALEGMPTDRHGLGVVEVSSRLFALGGKNNNGDVEDTLEVYENWDDEWHDDVEPMPRERYDFDVVAYDDLFFVFGGVDDDGQLVEDVDIYDWRDDEWTTGEPMPTPRTGPAAGVIEGINEYNASYESGIVVAGGADEDGDPVPTVEQYDPETDTWTTRTPMNQARDGGASVAFDAPHEPGERQRRLWVAGGQTADGESDWTAVYTRELEYKRHLQKLPEPRYDHSVAGWNDRLYVMGGQHQADYRDVWAYDPETGSYIEMPELPQVQTGLGTAALGKYVYAIGGRNDVGVEIADVWALDPVEGQWEQRDSMPSSRKHPAVVVVDDEIWVIGGYSNGVRSTVEIYDPDEGDWSSPSGSSLNDARTGAMATVHDGDVYVLGGLDEDGDWVTTVERFGEDADSWETLPTWAYEIRAAHGTAFSLGEDNIAVLGGRPGGEGSLWLADLEDDDVQQRPVFPGMQRSGAASHHGRLYAFGGSAEVDPDDTGVSTTRKFDLHGCVRGSQPLTPGWCTGLSHYPLYLVDYDSSTTGTGGNHWRGYRFEIAESATVDRLYGGGDGNWFRIGLYEADGDTPTELLYGGSSYGRRTAHDVDIELEAGQEYILAQGRDTGGSHYLIDSYDHYGVEGHSAIETWNPTEPGRALTFSTTGGTDAILGVEGSSETSRLPDMGLSFK